MTIILRDACTRASWCFHLVGWWQYQRRAFSLHAPLLVQSKRDRRAAQKLMRKLLKKQGMAPDACVTDKCPTYGAALRELRLSRGAHVQHMRANNRAESSHVPVRRRERKQQGFKSPGSAQRFLSLHTATYNTFTLPLHLVSAPTHRLFRAEAFAAWRNAASVAA